MVDRAEGMVEDMVGDRAHRVEAPRSRRAGSLRRGTGARGLVSVGSSPC